MIVKSIGQRSAGAGARILEYILRDEAVMKSNGEAILIRHNMRYKTVEEIEKAFLENEALRLHAPKNRIYYYHDILALSQLDITKVSVEVLEDLTREYLGLRAEKGMAVAAFHEDKHPHIHILLGSTEIVSGKALRVSREEFANIKVQLQEYQQRRYPELVSVVEHGKSEAYMSNEEYRMKERTRAPSRKDEIKEMLKQAFEKSYSEAHFLDNVAASGLKLYERSGALGIEDNRNYRLQTLGYGVDKMLELSQRQDRLNELKGFKEEEISMSQANEIGRSEEESIIDELTGHEREECE